MLRDVRAVSERSYDGVFACSLDRCRAPWHAKNRPAI